MSNKFKKPKQKCQRCKEKPAEELHTCPYQVEINDNEEFICNCCKDCRYECCMEI